MKMIAKLYFLVFFAISPLACTENCYYVLKDPLPKTGMFAVFQSVLCFLDIYENHGNRWNGLEVNFGTEGLYWAKDKGPNWWQYYFEPICINRTSPSSIESLDIFGLQKLCIKFGVSNIARNRGNYLVQKYVRIKPEIQKKVTSFYEKYMQDAFLIGVHYRGTDKVIEAPRVSYEQVYLKILEVMGTTQKKVKIFVATDEWQFISYISAKFPQNVCFTEATRATDSQPVHLYHNLDPYKNGLEAIVDCLLLSKCDVLIRTESHLSNTALMFNPNVIPYTLNAYYGQ